MGQNKLELNQGLVVIAQEFDFVGVYYRMDNQRIAHSITLIAEILFDTYLI